VREAAIKRLEGAGVGSPARFVDAALDTCSIDQTAAELQGRAVVLRDPEPWIEEVDGAALLDELAAIFRRYLVLPRCGPDALGLWTLHTFAFEATDTSPYAAFTSPLHRCGKTRSITILRILVSKPLVSSNITPAALFRTVEKFQPTLLVDEADTFLGDNEQLRGILNSGHDRETAVVVRTVGDDYEPRSFSTYCPKALAMIGSLHRTLEDRSIVFKMQRKAPGEKVEPLRRAHISRLIKHLEPLRRKAVRWVRDHLEVLKGANPIVPEGLNDRAQDNWIPLLAIADAVGGDWPERARNAAVVLSGCDDADNSPGVLLLADLRDLFTFTANQCEKLPTQEILKALHDKEERPWPEWNKGKPITSRQLASLLKPFGIVPKELWREGKKTRGYERSDFMDAFGRYLPSLDPVEGVESNRDGTREPTTEAVDAGFPTASENGENPREEEPLPDLPDGQEVCEESTEMEQGVV
jgi:putative DNA primase/helicase